MSSTRDSTLFLFSTNRNGNVCVYTLCTFCISLSTRCPYFSTCFVRLCVCVCNSIYTNIQIQHTQIVNIRKVLVRFVRSFVAFLCVAEFNSVCTHHLKIGHRSIFSPCFLPCAVFIAVAARRYNCSLIFSLTLSLSLCKFCNFGMRLPFSPLIQSSNISRPCLLSPFRSNVQKCYILYEIFIFFIYNVLNLAPLHQIVQCK